MNFFNFFTKKPHPQQEKPLEEDNIKIINLTKPKNSLLKLSKSFRKEADQKRWIHLASLQTLVLL